MNIHTRNKVSRITPIALTVIAGGLFVATAYAFNRQGKFIPKKDFERLLATDDKLILVTPLGEFRVTPIIK